MTRSDPHPRVRALRADLDAVAASIADFKAALHGVNDPELNDAFRTALEAADKTISFHLENIAPTIADDVSTLLGRFKRHPVPREDPDLGPTESLTRLRQARGGLFADLETVLEAVVELGLRPAGTSFALPVAVEKASVADPAQALEKRLGALEEALKRIRPEGEPSEGRSVQQIGLVNFYLGNMSVELALARMEALAKDLVDFAGLARAIENMGELTRDFVASVEEMRRKITDGLKAAARYLRPAVGRVVGGMKALVRRTRRQAPTSRSAEQPAPGPTAELADESPRAESPASDPHSAFWQLIQAGDAALVGGSLSGARRAYQEAETLAKTQLADNTGDPEWQRDLSVSFNRLGDVERAAGNLGAARERFEAGLAIAERLAALEPGNSEWQRDLSVSFNKLGDVEVAAGNLGAARERFEGGLAIRERLAALEPGNSQWQRDLSVSFNKLGDVEVAAGNLGAARERFEAGLAIRERLAALEPGNSQWQRDLSLSFNKLGDVERAAGNLGAARERFEADLAIADRLAALEPGNSEWQRDLYVSLDRLARIGEAEGDPAAAIAHYQRAEVIMAALAERSPSHPAYARDLAQIRAELARLGGKAAPSGRL
ncbi:MAG TPA: hypothetical protein VD846_12550 [Allosphingosinicella sp.]|nr:hypothetical protein [Allosphingosinicella sp.]